MIVEHVADQRATEPEFRLARQALLLRRPRAESGHVDAERDIALAREDRAERLEQIFPADKKLIGAKVIEAAVRVTIEDCGMGAWGVRTCQDATDRVAGDVEDQAFKHVAVALFGDSLLKCDRPRLK